VKITIIDYDAGNLRSVEKAVLHLGFTPCVSSDPSLIRTADKVILPGVGAFGDAMRKLEKTGMADAIKDVCASGAPFLGICLGLQLLFERSDESPGIKGLCVLPGKVVAMLPAEGIKIPHMGWNCLEITETGRRSGLFNGLPPNESPYVYFVHSYCARPAAEEVVAAYTNHGCEFAAAVCSENICATQFHPEKSSETGLRILENFLKI